VPITVLKNNVPWGPFTRAQIRDGLGRGDITLQYLAHAPGLKDWLPLGEVLDYFDRGVALPPVPTGRDTIIPVPSIDLPPTAAPALPPQPPALPVQTKRIPEPPPLPSVVPTFSPHVTPPLPMAASLEAPELKPAPFFRRFFAFAIDCLVLFAPIVFLFGLGALTLEIEGLARHTDPETMHQDWSLLWDHFKDLLLLVAFMGAWLYAALLESSGWQATVGKQWAGLKVTDRHGERLSFFRATGRHAAKFISALPCFLGFTVALFSSRGLAWHDRMAGTRVLKSSTRYSA